MRVRSKRGYACRAVIRELRERAEVVEMGDNEYVVWQAPDGAWWVKRLWIDAVGRRCTGFVAEFRSATEDNEANARLLADALACRSIRQ